MSNRFSLSLAVSALLATVPVSAASISGYMQTNLTSDISGLAAHTDANLKNPWGIAASATSPFWVSDNGTGLTTLYDNTGTAQSLVVTIPNPLGGISAPTGAVFTGGLGLFGGENFMFATEEGTIAGWRNALGTTAEVLSITGNGAVYKGLAVGTIGANSYLYAADFHNNRIAVFANPGVPQLPGNFNDPTLPSGYAPFNVQNLNGQIYVAYALRPSGSDDEQAGPGLGFVSVFDLNGNFLRRVVSQGALNAPWGLALTPAGFGGLAAGDLLVGNFGDGLINAYDSNGLLLGTIANAAGIPIDNDGLWALTFRGTSLYLTAGLNDENNGLFARIDAVPEPGTVVLTFLGLAGLVLGRRRAKVQGGNVSPRLPPTTQ